eukprot:11045888-Lingulodinium_polyedra.AAC.1
MLVSETLRSMEVHKAPNNVESPPDHLFSPGLERHVCVDKGRLRIGWAPMLKKNAAMQWHTS